MLLAHTACLRIKVHTTSRYARALGADGGEIIARAIPRGVIPRGVRTSRYDQGQRIRAAAKGGTGAFLCAEVEIVMF
jgi:hypothetical protein